MQYTLPACNSCMQEAPSQAALSRVRKFQDYDCGFQAFCCSFSDVMPPFSFSCPPPTPHPSPPLLLLLVCVHRALEHHCQGAAGTQPISGQGDGTAASWGTPLCSGVHCAAQPHVRRQGSCIKSALSRTSLGAALSEVQFGSSCSAWSVEGGGSMREGSLAVQRCNARRAAAGIRLATCCGISNCCKQHRYGVDDSHSHVPCCWVALVLAAPKPQRQSHARCNRRTATCLAVCVDAAT